MYVCIYVCSYSSILPKAKPVTTRRTHSVNRNGGILIPVCAVLCGIYSVVSPEH